MRFLFFISFLILLTFNTAAQNNFYKSELGFKSENDAYLGTKQDRYYTNGLFISFKQAFENKRDTSTKKIWSVSLGQEMYNAFSGQVTAIENIDRPFTAYLYLGGSLQWLKKNENSVKIETQIGTIGPDAQGEELQTFLHETVGFYPISGWQFQLNNEIGFNAVANFHYFLTRNKSKNLDLSLPIKANLGNTYSGLNVGILVRTGSLNPFYHSVATQSNVATKQQQNLKPQEFYFYLKPSLNFVAYNATIQGGLFRDDKGPVSFNPKRFVLAQDIGIAYAKNRWTANFTVVFKTKEIENLRKSEQYGSLDLYYRF
ncbi:lipid A deacylase LpxR family protein [Pedobacter alpinus]|uniref:Lipid A deacylase LpxR family protein n=1 Tax=Pedobacter alpinus TaxID=1590643 RepID=A0ABW5TRU2_9SPHI